MSPARGPLANPPRNSVDPHSLARSRHLLASNDFQGDQSPTSSLFDIGLRRKPGQQGRS